jgi:hypothetical protein
MKKISVGAAIGIALLLVVVPLPAFAGWNVDVHIGVPFPGLFYYYSAPPVVQYAPPAPVMGPVFFGGAWYRSSGRQWYISAYSGGPWYVIGSQYVPQTVISGPPRGGERHERSGYSAPRREYRYDGWQDRGPASQPYRDRHIEYLGGRHDD